MITKVHGDILLSEAHAIAHGIAPHDHFNQGLALALRERYPAMAQDFRHYCFQQNPKSGHAWLWAGPEKVVINLMTQEPALANQVHPGKASLKNINHALKELCGIIEKEEIKSIALPRLATGVGGLEWSDVEPLIEKYLGDLKIPVIVYNSYGKDEKAIEKNLKTA
ncbi:MAG: Appr-1-p processing protein [Nitrospinae bacterium CG11_big_fil_rev_8_21_14_0_20_45_15]|nr:MAG: Appr-1-p processing protein [Nitrospinae bacterium CG11_big_fil_rev_8_21_14_0_20_45_15]